MTASGGFDLGDLGMLDIFRSEVEAHADTLTANLLVLEKEDLQVARIQEMMRAAHSIKGAARIVGVEPAMRIAHVMEDCFVAAQEGRLKLTTAAVDPLLKGVDLLSRTAAMTAAPPEDWVAAVGDELPALEAAIRAVLTPPPVSQSPAIVPPVGGPVVREGTAVVVTFPGDLDAVIAETIRPALAKELQTPPTVIRLDFALVRDVDPVGLTLLAVLAKVASEAVPSPAVEVVSASADVTALLRATGLDATLRPVPSGGR